jgi:hypothetical protein
LKAANAFADAFEPTIRADGIEGEDLSYRHGAVDIENLMPSRFCLAS